MTVQKHFKYEILKQSISNIADRNTFETGGSPVYPLYLLKSVVTVSLEKLIIINALPKLELRDE